MALFSQGPSIADQVLEHLANLSLCVRASAKNGAYHDHDPKSSDRLDLNKVVDRLLLYARGREKMTRSSYIKVVI